MLQISVGPENHADVVEGAFEELRQMHSGLAEEHLRVLVEDEAFVDRNDDALVDFVAVDVQSHVTTAYRYRHLVEGGGGGGRGGEEGSREEKLKWIMRKQFS